jgi:hypothetical protein
MKNEKCKIEDGEPETANGGHVLQGGISANLCEI